MSSERPNHPESAQTAKDTEDRQTPEADEESGLNSDHPTNESGPGGAQTSPPQQLPQRLPAGAGDDNTQCKKPSSPPQDPPCPQGSPPPPPTPPPSSPPLQPPPPAVSHVTANPPDVADAPAWIQTAVDYFWKIDGGEKWRECVRLWIAFERCSDFDTGVRFISVPILLVSLTKLSLEPIS